MRHWFEPMADHLGEAYLRYSFTKGTEQEVDFLVEVLDLQPGRDRVLDVGCGPGRHAHALARRGIDVVGIDISERFVELARRNAPPQALFEVCDARRLPFVEEFDAVISLCQGAFGLVGEDDPPVLDGMARAAKAGTGRVALTAFSSYFAIRYLEETDSFDAANGINHERTTVRNEQGEEAEFDLWTSCFTPRELRLLCARSGLTVDALWAVTPGAYGRNQPDLDHPEWLVVARKAGGSTLS